MTRFQQVERLVGKLHSELLQNQIHPLLRPCLVQHHGLAVQLLAVAAQLVKATVSCQCLEKLPRIVLASLSAVVYAMIGWLLAVLDASTADCLLEDGRGPE